jgi:cation diffusion facilitator CzcD-associated flavoprotein CzcO
MIVHLSSSHDMDLHWLIIGGGIHGVHLALVLRERCGIAAEQMQIIDPHEQLLARWEACTTACGMRYLRSTVVHHLAPDPHDLLRFAQQTRAEAYHFHGRYQRPSLAIFRAHSWALIERYRLVDLTQRGRVKGLVRREEGWCVETDRGAITARNVILALGIGEQLRWPVWASALRAAGAPIYHLYEPGFDRTRIGAGANVVIIGGGISAAHLALALCTTTPVTLVMRHPIKIAPFDSPPGWMGPKELRRFHAEPDMRHRRAMINQARLPGTMPVELAQALTTAVQHEHLQLVIDEVRTANYNNDDGITLTLNDATLHAATVILATGFTGERPGCPWLDEAIAAYDLPVAACGYPIVRPDLQWTQGLYVSGALAELELGPVARNIVGARHAGERLTNKVRG